MTETEKHLLSALQKVSAQSQEDQAALRVMFDHTSERLDQVLEAQDDMRDRQDHIEQTLSKLSGRLADLEQLLTSSKRR